VAKARTRRDNRTDWATGFTWPAQGRLSGFYGSQRVLNGEPRRPHFGVDVAAPTGTPVLAPAPGVVTLAEPDLFYSGGTLIIDHGQGLTSSFLHLSAVSVSVGDTVTTGDRIGAIGATGRASGPHLDWRMNWYDKRVDPQPLAGDMPAN
jgi:murein DD-endopeptidase MepM/ murein hydrolase activator NlpD